jgi:hypothetical protein
VLAAKLQETEQKIEELSAFREHLLYYRERASALSGGVLPTDRYCEDVSFCGCLEAVTEGGEKLWRMIASANAAGCLATSAAVTAAVRNMPANRNRAGDPPPALYSPECVEGEFSEVRPSPNERSRSLPITKITRRVQDILQTLKEVENMNGGKGIYVGGTLLSILISLALYATGRRESAIFVGLWAPTILNLGQSLLEED